MARVGISLEKQVSFRDSVQPFSNVYYYDNGAGALPNQAEAETMIDNLVLKERSFHSSDVTYNLGRLWSQTGSQSTNEMIAQKPISGAGTANTSSSLDRERAYLFQWEAGFDSRGHRVYLRKWYHTCGVFPGATAPINAGILQNIIGFSSGERVAMSNNADDILTLAGGGGGWGLCSKAGRMTTAASPGAHRYLEHHQLGDQWRG